jgi:hypothetical protein
MPGAGVSLRKRAERREKLGGQGARSQLVCLVQPTNETDQINKRDQPVLALQERLFTHMFSRLAVTVDDFVDNAG